MLLKTTLACFTRCALPVLLIVPALAEGKPTVSGNVSQAVQKAGDDLYAERMAKACKDLTLRASGMAEKIEAKLGMDAKQKPLFDAWRSALLDSIKRYEYACAPGRQPGNLDLIERIETQQRIYINRAEALKAEVPSLAALRAALSDSQKAEFDSILIQARFKMRKPAEPPQPEKQSQHILNEQT